MSHYMDHEAGRVFLLEMSGILDSLGLPFFLVQGTALGAYRDGGFTPTEGDIDIGFLQEDFAPKVGELCEVLVNAGFDIHTISKPLPICRLLIAHKYGVHADLVGYTRYQDKRFASAPIDPVAVPEPYCLVHEAAALENYQWVTLFGRVFRVPSPIEQYLEREYGAEWHTPMEDHVSRTRVYDFLKDNPEAYPC